MAVANTLGATRGSENSGTRAVPPPLPVSLRLECAPWQDLPRELLLDLRNRLTNHEGRGDRKDDGIGAGSLMRELIDDYIMGVISAQGWWVVTVWPEGSRYRGPVAWCLLRPESRSTPTMKLGFYTDPSWRKRGLGRLIVNEVLRLCNRIHIERVTASPWNITSHCFFEGAGFATMCRYNSGMGALSEMDVPNVPPARLPWRCRAPEAM